MLTDFATYGGSARDSTPELAPPVSPTAKMTANLADDCGQERKAADWRCP